MSCYLMVFTCEMNMHQLFSPDGMFEIEVTELGKPLEHS